MFRRFQNYEIEITKTPPPILPKADVQKIARKIRANNF